jgi:hypothetical protein
MTTSPILDQLLGRQAEARARLRSALVAGAPTEAHRAALSQLSGDIERERAVLAQADDVAEQHHTSMVADRAATITDEVRERTAALLARFPIHQESE